MKKVLLLGLTAVLMLASSELWAQDAAVSGTVTSADDGTPLPGVNVVLKGTTTGVVTDADGRYSITAPADGTLVFTFIGLTSQEVAINNRTNVDVIMATDVQQLSEVVVTALGIEREKASLGLSFRKSVWSCHQEKQFAWRFYQRGNQGFKLLHRKQSGIVRS
jgi:hypothetical protein